MLLVAIPIGVILLAMIFGYLLPGWSRRRRKAGPLAIIPLKPNTAASVPPRPARFEPPPPPPQAAAATPRPAESYAPPTRQPQPNPEPNQHREEIPRPQAVTEAMDAIEARSAAQQGALDDQRRVLKLQVAGDPRRDFHRGDHNPPSSTLRLERNTDGTLQFLPGKLEIIEGRDVGQEVRFVRTGGADGQTITFGRSEGPQYRHVQLYEHTVSRQHAKMVLDGKTWTLINFSRTNPVVVNGLALMEEGAHVVLRDGDRIEMGEVVFRFRAR